MPDEPLAFPLLRTKLHPPLIPEDWVPRPQLLAWLDKYRQRPFTLVSAAAGSGKSVLISSWLKTCAWPSAWLSLDDADNDVHVFLTYVLAAIQRRFPEACQPTQALLNATEHIPVAVVTRSLVNDLDGIEAPFVLVLDDYHRIHNTSVHDVLTAVLDYPPLCLHLMLITRRDPPLPLVRYRGQGQMHEIRTQSLHFALSETVALLQKMLAVPVDDATAALIHERTEGWVVGVRLAALSVHGREDADRILHHLPVESREVMDYLVAEVLSHLPSAHQEVLLRTSILERFCAPLCDAMVVPESQEASWVGGGEAFVAWLAASNLFVVPLDPQHQWFRYHHLFQQMIQRQLQRHYSPEHIASLHARAGAWLADNGLIEEALHHTLAAGDPVAAGQIVAQHGYDLVNDEQWRRLERWLRLLPDAIVSHAPELLLLQAWTHTVHSRYGELMPCLDQVEALLSAPRSASTDAATLHSHFNALYGCRCYLVADGTRALTYLQQADDHLPRHHRWTRIFVCTARALAYQMIGELGNAHAVIQEAMQDDTLRGGPSQGFFVAISGFVHWIAGNLTALRQTAEHALTREQLAHPQTVPHGRYFLGIALYERNALAAAAAQFAAVIEDRYRHHAWNVAHSAFALARISQARGQTDEANQLGALVVSYALETHNTTVLQVAQAFQADLALRQGRLAEAVHWADGFVATPLYPMYRFYVPQVTLVRVRLAQDTPESRAHAADLLAQLDDFVTRTHNTRVLIDVRALQALLHDARNDEPAAFTAVTEALALAEPSGFIRAFVDLGPGMATLLQRLSPHQGAVDYIAQLLAAFQAESPGVALAASAPPSPSAPSARPEPVVASLTKQERRILHLLAQKMSQREIADQLFVSPETVKTHVKHLYRKLNAHTRQQAIAHATAMGLLPST